jgi:hypothetical protein
MEATCSTKPSVDILWTTLHYIPEDKTLKTKMLEVEFCFATHMLVKEIIKNIYHVI